MHHQEVNENAKERQEVQRSRTGLSTKLNLYDVDPAMEIVTKTAKAKFDETVEVHVRLGVDGRHADQQVRGAIVLPHGTGKNVRRFWYLQRDLRLHEAEEAGADFVGAEEMAQKIQQ